MSRACLADDLFNLARFGLASYKHVFRLLTVWSSVESDHAPWQAVINNMQLLLDAAAESNRFGGLRRFVAEQTAVAFERLVQSPSLPPLGQTISARLSSDLTRFACTSLQLADCAARMRAPFERMRVELRNLSASDAFPRLDEAYTVLCTGLAMPTAGGGWSDWALVHDAIGSVDDGPLNRMLIRALACAVQPAMQRGFVGLLERESVRRYRTTVFQMAGRNAVLRMFVLEYLLGVEQRRTDDVMGFFGSLASQWEFDMVCVSYTIIAYSQKMYFW